MSRTLAGIVMAAAGAGGALTLPMPGTGGPLTEEAILAQVAKEAPCDIDWRDLKAIRTKESGSAVLHADGRVLYEDGTPVRGDGGLSYGPFQFYESAGTWDRYGNGGDPDRLDDSAAATARMLCANAYPSNRRGAIRQHNGSGPAAEAYADSVLAMAAEVDTAGVSPAKAPGSGPAAVATDPAARPKLGARFDEGYQDLGGLIDVGCEHVDGQPRLSAACAAAQRAWWGDQQTSNMPAGNAPGAIANSPAPSRWLTPCEGPVTSGFGPRVAPIEGARTFHPGLDLACGLGTPAKASAAGTVIFAGWDGGFGNSVQLEHPGGTSTSYNHLSAVMVVEGQRVAAGGTVGLVGSTGVSTGPHLHFELWEGGVPVDPAGRLGL